MSTDKKNVDVALYFFNKEALNSPTRIILTECLLGQNDDNLVSKILYIATFIRDGILILEMRMLRAVRILFQPLK